MIKITTKIQQSLREGHNLNSIDLATLELSLIKTNHLRIQRKLDKQVKYQWMQEENFSKLNLQTSNSHSK